jgi:hypothetical protein
MRKLFSILIALAAIVAVTASSFGGSMTLLGVGKAPGGGGATLTYTPTDVSQAWNNVGASSVTFNPVNIGPVAADRIVVVSLTIQSSVTVSPTVTVGGLSMTNATGVLGQGTGLGGYVYIFWRLVTAADINATTAPIAVSSAGGFNNVAITVGNINGSATASNNNSQGYSWAQAGSTFGPATPLTINAGGLEISCAEVDRNDPTSASNITRDNVNQNPGSFAHTHISGHGTNVSPTFTIAGNFFTAMVTAAFAP